jgi:hypothetical protein
MKYLPRLHDTAAEVVKVMGDAQPLAYYLAIVQHNAKAGLKGANWQIADPNLPYGTPCSPTT